MHMLIKIVGICSIAMAAILVGYRAAQNVKGRIDELLYVKRLMIMFQGELRYKNVTLSDGFMTVSRRANGIYRTLFERLSIATEQNYSKSMAQLFEENIDSILVGNTLLSREDICRLKELGETMGYQDQKMQLANIDLYIDRLSEAIEEDRMKMKDTMKMYRTLGVLSGLASIIVFL